MTAASPDCDVERPGSSPDRGRAGLRAAQVALLAGLVLAVVSVPYLPTNDGPQHIFTLHATNHLEAPDRGWSQWLEPHQPLSSRGFATVFTPLDLLLSWRAATRVALAVMVAVWAAGAFALARAIHPGRGWLGVAVAAAALQWALYMGFFNFYLASGFGLFVLAIAFRGAPETPARLTVLALMLLVQALFHLVAAALTGLVLVVLALVRSGPGRRSADLLRVALVGAPAAVIALAATAVRVTSGMQVEVDANVGGTGLLSPWWTLARCFTGGPAWRAWPLTLAALISIGLGLGLRRRNRSAADRALLIAGGALFAAAALLPLHLPSWHFFSVRFLPLGIPLLVLALPVESLPPLARRGVSLACLVFAGTAALWAAAHHRDLAARSAPALAGLESGISRQGPRLPIVLDPLLGRTVEDAKADMPFTAPFLNLGKLYAAEQGGMVPHTFASDPSIHAALLTEEGKRRLPPAADPRFVLRARVPGNEGDLALREAVTVYLAAHGTRYEDVILAGRPEDADHLEWLGFEPDWRENGLLIARFRGCPLTVHFPDASSLPDDMVLEVGWYPALGVTHRYSLARAPLAPDGSRTLPLRQSCGGLWLRLAHPSLACEGADGEGRLVVTSTRQQPEIHCRVRSAELTDAPTRPFRGG